MASISASAVIPSPIPNAFSCISPWSSTPAPSWSGDHWIAAIAARYALIDALSGPNDHEFWYPTQKPATSPVSLTTK